MWQEETKPDQAQLLEQPTLQQERQGGNSPDTRGDMSPHVARATLLHDRKERTKSFLTEVGELQRKYRIRLVPVMTIRDGQVASGIDVIAED